MELNNDLITQFAKIATIKPKDKSATTVRGTIHISEGRNYITIDGAAENSMTPVETTVELNDGDRVIAVVKDHSIVVTGNKTHPAIGTMTAGNLYTQISKLPGEVMVEVGKEYNPQLDTINNLIGRDDETGLRGKIASAHSKIEALPGSITTTVKETYIDPINEKIGDEKDPESLTGKIVSAESKIEALPGSITTTVKETYIDPINGKQDEFSIFMQEVNGFTFMGNEGTVKISHGDINLTGAITWDDLDDETQKEIEKGKDALDEFNNLSIPSLPSYIKSAYIDGARIEAPTIIGGEIYAVGSKPEDENATFTTMDENGFYLYSNMSKADADNTVHPKISLYCAKDTDYVNPMIILGSGESDEHIFHNRFIIEKGGSYVRLRYRLDYSGKSCGLTFNKDGTIDVEGDLSISAITSLRQEVSDLSGRLDSLSFSLPVGTILLSYTTSSPASYLTGSWERVSAAFIYMTNDNSKVGKSTIGDVVTAGGTASADYLCVAAWRRVS